MKTYDPAQFALIVGGVPMSGYADGEFINVSRAEDSFTAVSGADGLVSRSKSNDKRGVVVITLQQTSGSNDVLFAFLEADELTNVGVLPIIIKDNSGRTVCAAGHAWVRKPADVVGSKEIENREWTIDCADLIMAVAGNADVEPSV